MSVGKIDNIFFIVENDVLKVVDRQKYHVNRQTSEMTLR